ncbi:MAG TPA: SRPBCC family protein [Ilumatobacter sp.]
MTAVVKTRVVASPSERVWDVLAAFERIAEWAPEVDHSSLLTEHGSGVGAVRRVQLGRMVLTETVRTWQAGSGLSYTIAGLPPVVRSVVNTWQLEPASDGTLVVLTTEIDAGPRPPQLLIARAVGRRLGAAGDSMLAGLAAHLERQERPT